MWRKVEHGGRTSSPTPKNEIGKRGEAEREKGEKGV